MSDRAKTEAALQQNAIALEYAAERLAAARTEQGRLMLAARELDPPITYRELARIYSMTDAGVIKKLERTRALTEASI